MDNNIRQFYLGIDTDTDIPLLMKMLTTPRLDGKQQVICLIFSNGQLTMKMLDTINQVLAFLTCQS
jgi:hypothetical protein